MEYRQERIGSFIELANNHHPTIKFTAEISDTEITFLDTCVHKGYRLEKESILDVRTHFYRQNLSSTQNFPPVTLRESGKASLKVKL